MAFQLSQKVEIFTILIQMKENNKKNLIKMKTKENRIYIYKILVKSIRTFIKTL